MIINDIPRHYREQVGRERATGKTFRRVCESFEQASAGNHVYYVVNNEQMKRWTGNYMLDALHGFFGNSETMVAGGRQHTGMPHDKYYFEFPTGGFIKVVTENEWNHRPIPTDVKATYTIIEMWDVHS